MNDVMLWFEVFALVTMVVVLMWMLRSPIHQARAAWQEVKREQWTKRNRRR